MIRKLANIPVTTTFDQVRRKLGIVDAEDREMMAKLFEEAKAIARPKALYREVFVEEISGRNVRINGHSFESDVLAMNLKNIHRAFAYVCTCGTEVDDWSHREKDEVIAFWLDMIKGMFMVEAIGFFREHLKCVYQFEKLSAVNPGSGNKENWPIAQQVPLFAMIGNVKEAIGVTLERSFLMTPTKSVSGLIFPSETEFSNCALCSREICPNRRVAFDQELYNRAFHGTS